MFRDREEAGSRLADRLLEYEGRGDALVLAIPRGGIPVGYEIARRLGLPLDVVVIKKIGAPYNEEFALGAAGIDSYILNDRIDRYGISDDYLQSKVREKQAEIRKRYVDLRGDRPLYELDGKSVIITDDGVATGATMIMAIQLIRRRAVKEIVVAVPVAPPTTVDRLGRHADRVVVLDAPPDFMALSQFYRDFGQVPESEAKRILERARS